jgi:hypothetical protein
MNLTLEDMIKELNDSLEERKKYADFIQKLLGNGYIQDKAYRRFFQLSDELEVGFYKLEMRDRNSYRLILKSVYKDIPVDRPLYVSGKSRFVKSFGLVLGSQSHIMSKGILTRLNYGKGWESVAHYDWSLVGFNVLLKQWGNLKEEERMGIDILKEQGLKPIMPEIMRQLAVARKQCIWEARKWKILSERMHKEFEPWLVAEAL